MKMPLNSSQTIAVVAIVIALAAGAYALGRSTGADAPLAATDATLSEPAPVTRPTAARVSPDIEPAPAPAANRLCNECSRVVSVRSEVHKGSGSGLGAVGGALIGGLLGNQVGGGNGKKLATVGGAVAGGMAGNEIEKRNKSESVWIVTLANADGSTHTHQQRSNPELQAGDVVVVRDGQLQRR
jgi:outer membrane lipoprotein SlyB